MNFCVIPRQPLESDSAVANSKARPMDDVNPYREVQVASPTVQADSMPVMAIVWWSLVIAGTVVPTIAWTGYVVLAGRFPQWYFLVVLLAWAVGCLFTLAIPMIALFLRPKSSWYGWATAIVAVLAIANNAVGWGGVRNAFFELLAG